jgi:CheY-like chemotaxis protein
MGLEGSLEDLALLEILQIIAFSRKTGLMTVETGPGEAVLVFLEGRVVAAFDPDSPPLDARAASLAGEARHRLIRGRIELTLERLTRLRDGLFRFELTAEPASEVGSRDIRAERLAEGINPEELLLELARGMDEGRRDSQAAVESGPAEPAPEVLLSAAAAEAPADAIDEMLPLLEIEPQVPSLAETGDRHRIVLLVDDEEDIRMTLSSHLVEGGCQVVEAGDAVSAVKIAKGLADVGFPFVLILDRGMPASDSSSFDGGLEVLKWLRQADLAPPTLLMTDRMTLTLTARARRLGVARLVFKPGLSRLDPGQFDADLRAFAGLILREFLPALEAMADTALLPPPSGFVPLPRSVQSWDDVAALQRRLEELDTPGDALEVSVLVMKAARDFFERGLFLLVKDDALRGLGSFGGSGGQEQSLAVRDLVLPLTEPSAFADVVASGRPFHGPLPEREWTRLAGTLGPRVSASVSVLPLVSNREPIALLFGDNPQSGNPRRALDTLEIFLTQAGVVLESIFLRRKLGVDGHAPSAPLFPGAVT